MTNTRVQLGEMLIKLLEDDDDPETLEVIERLRAQIAALQEQAANAPAQPEDKPAAQVIGLKTVALKARR